jgi:predicted GH43/DUF377 family glycosyl hydrolase
MKWNKKGLIFQPSDAPEFGFTHTQCPTPLVLEDRIRIFFGGRQKDGKGAIYYLDVDAENPSKLIKIYDKPMLVKGSLGNFDQDGVLQVAVKRNKDKLFLYYGGFSKMVSSPHTCMMGIAVSSDNGNSFTRLSEGPILPISKTDPLLIGSADIILHDNKWHMIYTSGTKWHNVEDQPELSYALKYASSVNGIDWEPSGIIVIPQEAEINADCKPSVFKIGNTFHMYFSTRKIVDYHDSGSNSYRFGYATSNDLINWQRNDSVSGIGVSAEGWDSAMICYSNIIQIGEKFIMFYNGNSFGKNGFGYAELDIKN